MSELIQPADLGFFSVLASAGSLSAAGRELGVTTPAVSKHLANPVGTFWSVVMLLEHLGEHEAARRLMAAIEAVTANPALHTGDLGGQATTRQVTEAVCAHLGAPAH